MVGAGAVVTGLVGVVGALGVVGVVVGGALGPEKLPPGVWYGLIIDCLSCAGE